jgi:hypothetical protein
MRSVASSGFVRLLRSDFTHFARCTSRQAGGVMRVLRPKSSNPPPARRFPLRGPSLQPGKAGPVPCLVCCTSATGACARARRHRPVSGGCGRPLHAFWTTLQLLEVVGLGGRAQARFAVDTSTVEPTPALTPAQQRANSIHPRAWAGAIPPEPTASAQAFRANKTTRAKRTK